MTHSPRRNPAELRRSAAGARAPRCRDARSSAGLRRGLTQFEVGESISAVPSIITAREGFSQRYQSLYSCQLSEHIT